MEGVHAVIRTEKKRSFLDRLGRDMRRYWRVYVMLLPVVAFYLVFKYGSMGSEFQAGQGHSGQPVGGPGQLCEIL